MVLGQNFTAELENEWNDYTDYLTSKKKCEEIVFDDSVKVMCGQS